MLENQAASISPSFVVIFSIIGLAVILLGGLIFFFRNMNKFSEESRRTERDFEMSMMNDFTKKRAFQKNENENEATPAINVNSNEFLNKSVVENLKNKQNSSEYSSSTAIEADAEKNILDEALLPQQFSVNQSKNIGGNTPRPDNLSTPDKIIDKLRAAGIVSSVEGPLPGSAGTPENMFVRLRSGKTIMIIPHFESEYYFHANMKKTDYVILILNNGSAVVVSSISDFIARNIS